MTTASLAVTRRMLLSTPLCLENLMNTLKNRDFI